MCGRFTLAVSASVLAKVFDLDSPLHHSPRFNIAPTQDVPIVRAGAEGDREWAFCRWGLIPSWATEPGVGARMINARSESAAEKPSFRKAFASSRCLVPSDGFFEWVTTPSGKQPYHIRFSDRRAFAFAGLWERWGRGPDNTIDSFTILTTAPNTVAATIHHRMPVILAPESWEEWLKNTGLAPERRNFLTRPFPSAGMEAIPVSTRVNSPVKDDVGCLEPAGTLRQSGQLSLYSRFRVNDRLEEDT